MNKRMTVAHKNESFYYRLYLSAFKSSHPFTKIPEVLECTSYGKEPIHFTSFKLLFPKDYYSRIKTSSRAKPDTQKVCASE